MKHFTRFVCFLLIAAILMAIPTQASETSSTWASSYFGSSCVYLAKTSDSSFEVWFGVTAVRTMDQLGASTIKVQKSNDGSNWTTMITYTKANNSHFIATNTVSHSSYVTYYGTAGCYYRAIIVLYAKNGTGTAEMTEYTSVLKL